MNLQELSILVGEQLVIRFRTHTCEYPWYCSMDRVEVSEGAMLKSSFGNGTTPHMALEDYAEEIRGKKIIVNATGHDRCEFQVPSNLTVE